MVARDFPSIVSVMFSFVGTFSLTFGIYLATLAVIIAVGTALESHRPAEAAQPLAERRREWAIVAMNGAIRSAVGPSMALAATTLAEGGQWAPIHLRDHGWWFLPSLIIWMVVFDGMGYWVHRAAHQFRLLWALHSLHHSAVAVNTTTAQRHTWIENLIQMIIPWPLAAVLIDVPPSIILVSGLLTQFLVIIMHANVSWNFGQFWWLIASPAFHRLHHSRLLEHRDRNFAVFPVWDIIFGTVRRPNPATVTVTGLDDGDRPLTFAEALIWSWREWFRRDSKNRKSFP
jgi:sterol desaturase/sphingolipid hydroxylase (fatty acid hydroxylase superfamily)